jgi:hypothetical protein
MNDNTEATVEERGAAGFGSTCRPLRKLRGVI